MNKSIHLLLLSAVAAASMTFSTPQAQAVDADECGESTKDELSYVPGYRGDDFDLRKNKNTRIDTMEEDKCVQWYQFTGIISNHKPLKMTVEFVKGDPRDFSLEVWEPKGYDGDRLGNLTRNDRRTSKRLTIEQNNPQSNEYYYFRLARKEEGKGGEIKIKIRFEGEKDPNKFEHSTKPPGTAPVEPPNRGGIGS